MAGEEKIRVLIVDDDPNFVEAATALLAADQRLEVVGGAGDGEEAVAMAAALRPQVVAMDVVMPGMDGFEAARMIRSSARSVGLSLSAARSLSSARRRVWRRRVRQEHPPISSSRGPYSS
jgi:DNA-binding NarL/FixJ family response regulator